jgi:hypothetical protein
MNIGKALGLAATKKLRIKKRKILKKAMNKPAMYHDTKAIDLYDTNKDFIKINYKNLFKKV